MQGVDVSKAGVRIQELARQRRNKAFVRFAGVAALTVAPIFILLLLPTTPELGILIWVVCLASAATLWQQGRKLWIRAILADQGASGEEKVAQLLKTLLSQGWRVKYNIPLKQWGDADVFLRSHRGNCFVIDTKTNKGGVFFDGSVLKRRYGKQVYEFDNGKDLLKAVTGQAHSLKYMKQVTFVQPILCFTQANLEKIEQDKELNGVYVVNSAKLVSLLNRLDGN